ncbi:hypothetical protein pb186bvf_000332 [Paramecium bursaria]
MQYLGTNKHIISTTPLSQKQQLIIVAKSQNLGLQFCLI